MSPEDLQPLPQGCHYEIRRCLIARCRGEEMNVRNWETVGCYFSAEEVPSRDEYFAKTLYASAYPHVSLVIVRPPVCRQPFGPRTGGLPPFTVWK